MLMAPISGLRNLILCGLPSACHSTVSPASRPMTTRMYSAMSASLMRFKPMVRRPVKPVETPNSMRPGASWLSEPRALAVTAGMRFDGISTPVVSLIDLVTIAAAPIATKRSALRSCVSKNDAAVKPSSSARLTRCQLSAWVARAMPYSMSPPGASLCPHGCRAPYQKTSYAKWGVGETAGMRYQRGRAGGNDQRRGEPGGSRHGRGHRRRAPRAHLHRRARLRLHHPDRKHHRRHRDADHRRRDRRLRSVELGVHRLLADAGGDDADLRPARRSLWPQADPALRHGAVS